MTHIAFHPHVQHVQGKLDHTEFTNLGFLCSSLWWNLCKRPPLNDTYQTGDGTPNADGTIWWIHMTLSVWSSCTGGRWCDTEEEQWTMFLFPRNVPQLKGLQCGLNTSLHANCCSVCSSSQKNKKVLSFIKKGWDETFENITKDSTLLLWKPWYNHILRSTWKYVYFQSLTMKNIAEATKRSRAQPMCNRSTKYTKSEESNALSNTSDNSWGHRKYKEKGQHKILGPVCLPETASAVSAMERQKSELDRPLV